MRKLSLVSLVCLWALAAAIPLQADDKPAEKKALPAEKEKSADEKPSRESRIKTLLDQLKKIQHALIDEGVAHPPGWLLDSKEQQRMADYEKKMQEEMTRQMQKRTKESFPAGTPFLSAAGDPATQTLFQMEHLLQQIDMLGGPGSFPAASGSHDPIEIGQQMVIAGLEVQLKGLASNINATKDKETHQKLKAEFHEIVEKVVDARKKQRDRTIKQLEKRLAELKKQADSDESADAMVKRLLEPEQGEKSSEAKPGE